MSSKLSKVNKSKHPNALAISCNVNKSLPEELRNGNVNNKQFEYLNTTKTQIFLPGTPSKGGTIVIFMSNLHKTELKSLNINPKSKLKHPKSS